MSPSGFLKTAFGLLWSSMFLLTGLVTAQDVRVPEKDSLALVAFYHSMNGDNWRNKGGWLTDRVDTWYGVTTENVGTTEAPEWRVVQIELNDNMTQPGTIPPEIGDLEYLTDLVLRGDPALFGEWPMEIENLVNIFEIRTQDTNMSGEIPWESLAKTSIKRIRFQEAKHRGEIPDAVFNDMTQLQRMEISNAYLSGSIPSSITSLVNLRRFRLQGNLLTGDIPDMSVIPDIEQFHVNGNPFNPGPVWPMIQTWSEKLEELRIDNTNRTGTVPEWMTTDLFAVQELTLGEQSWDLENALGGEFPDLSALVEMDQLHIHGPHWEGNLPEWIGTKGMRRVYFYYCSFGGTIPASYVNITGIFSVQHCPEIEGGIPAEFQVYTGSDFVLEMADSWNNPYSRFGEAAAAYFGSPKMSVGEIPSYISGWSAEEIVLKNVGLTGTIPEGIVNNTGLATLDLSDNPGLTGSLPGGLFDLPISALNVSNTGLDVTGFPEGLANLELSLESLGMAGLGLTGSIPATIGNFPLLQSLDLSGNALSGSIPSEMGNLSLMIALNLADNDLSGDLPSELADMGYLAGFYTLNALDLSGNSGLSGTLPARLAEANRMQILRYDGTGVAAPDNAAFSDWLATVIPGNSGLSFPPLYVDVQTSGLVTSNESAQTPVTFRLERNYPNPFNPTTRIAYQIPESGLVTLSVYNLLGQQVATLVNTVQPAGVHHVEFDAADLASGTYLYRLTAGDHSMTRSMMLIK